jgi:hypothetical protein
MRSDASTDITLPRPTISAVRACRFRTIAGPVHDERYAPKMMISTDFADAPASGLDGSQGLFERR